MNSVCLVGNLTRDPEVRYSSGAESKAVARFSIAINEGYGEKQRTNYINIVCFGKTAENCEKYIHKGSKVGITGRIQSGSYEKDGRTVYTTDIIADRVEFLNTKSDNTAGGGNDTQGGEMLPGFTEIDSDMPF